MIVQFEELESLSHRGVAIICCTEQIGTNNLVGTELIVSSFLQKTCEYLRSMITACKWVAREYLMPLDNLAVYISCLR